MLHPKLYKKDSKGKVRFWQVETDEAGSYRTIAGELLGNPVTSEWTICKPKNVGQSNETTAVTQCQREVAALYTKKRDKHYVDTVLAVDDERKYFEVMLAATYDDKTKRLIAAEFVRGWSIITQPKLDGLRGPTSRHGTISRGGNEFTTVRFLSEALAPIFADHPGLVFDGEVYNHEYAADFNEIVSVVKNGGSAAQVARARELAQLHVYDLYDPVRPDDKFSVRYARLQELLESYRINPHLIYVVNTDFVRSFEELDEKYDEYLDDGYEGEMIRFDAPYEHKRTKALLKRKETISAEFPIVRIEEGKGNWAGYAKRIFVEVPNGGESKAGIKGTQPFLHGVLLEAAEYAGGTATIEFFGFTADGKLRFGRASRLYKGKRDD